jgi:hypothetical protein
MPEPNLEDDWQALGRPSPTQRAIKAAPEATMTFLEFLFTWIGKAFSALGRAATTVVVTLGRAIHHFFEVHLGSFILLMLATTICGGGSWAVWKKTQASGLTHHCYIETSAYYNDDGSKTIHGYRLVGVRHWAPDLVIRQDQDFKVLRQTAEDIYCPIE